MDLGTLYRDIVETSLDGIWVFDSQGRTLYANPAIAQMLGLEPHELETLTTFDPLDDAGRRQMADHLRDLASGRVNQTEVECLWHRRDGSELWVTVRESVLYDEDGEVAGYLNRVSDYSERRRLFEELRHNRQMLAEAERIAKVGSWEWDLRSDVITASDELHVLYGISREDFGGTFSAFLDLVHPDDRAVVDEAVRKAIDGADTFDFEARVHSGDGNLTWIRGRGEVFRDIRGTPVWARGTHQDVTDAKEAELALKDLVAQNTLMQAVATAANESQTLIDVLRVAGPLLIGHDDWVRGRGFVPDANQPGRLVQLHIDRVQRDADALDTERVAREHALAMRSYQKRGQVWDETDPDQPLIAFPVIVGEDIAAVLVITASARFERHDMIRTMIDQVAVQLARVAERDRAAQELAATRDAAMAASRQKSEFLASMSHEIRTPLNGVIGLTDLLLRTELDPHQQRLATGAQAAGRSLLAVINEVLDFSKIEAGRLEVERVDFDVREVFDQVASVLAESARSKGLELHVSCHPDVPERLNGDPTRLAQVLTNLGSNAVKFTPSGEVSIRAVAEPEQAGQVVLRVEVVDDGIGIPADKLDHIFHPFTQADTSTTRQYGGTGLGLAIAGEIVAVMGGRIGVDSEVGKGSRFWFTVRLGTPSASTPHAPGRALEPLRGRRILVVDDNANNRLILREHLERWKAAPTVVETSEAALAVLRRAAADAQPFDGVLVNITASTERARELVEAVRADATVAGVPLVVLLPGDAAGEAMAAAGATECLTKPVLAGDVQGGLARALPGVGQGRPSTHPEDRVRDTDRPRLLVVEDNPVNQIVALGILENLGFAADTADDGEQAVERWREGSYGAILMDVQMPRMDGYAATRAIRDLEGQGSHVPVMAMTAAAVEGERERCLAAGMDDFLTKPVNPQALAEVLRRWLDVDAAARTSAPTAPDVDDGVLDLERLDMLRDLDPGNTAYLDRAIGNFVGRAPESVRLLREAVASADHEALTQAAHRLKGSALNLGLPAVGSLAFELEMLGDSGATAGAEALLDRLEEALAQGVERVRGYQDSYRSGR